MDFPEIPGYDIQEEIGRGSMGVVYRARQVALDRVVALKVMNPRFSQDEEFVKSFSQEARTVARLSHPNIVTVHDFGSHEGLYYLTMQFVHGKTVKDLIGIRRPAPLECAQILTQVADALDYAHRNEVIHRDVKPSNIMLCPDGKAMIMDFGVASGYYAGAKNEIWQAAGTPTYMSPEQCSHLKASPRSDQYSLAVTLYEMVTGRTPFTAVDPNAMKHAHIHSSPPPLRLGRTDITPRMEACILRALSKMPDLRFVTVNDFAREFETACKERPPDDILVGVAPGAEPSDSAAQVVSMVGGEAFATRSRGTHSTVYKTAIRGAADSRRRRSLVVVLFLLVLCGGAGAAVYMAYFKDPVHVTTAVKKKTAKKTTRKRSSGSVTRSTGRSGRSLDTSAKSVPDDTPKQPEEKPDYELPETPDSDPEHPVEEEKTEPDEGGKQEEPGGKSDESNE